MSVGVVLPQHQAAIRGGIATYVRGLTRALREHASEDVVLATPGRRDGPGTWLTRLLYEELALPGTVGPADVLHLTDLRLPRRAPRARTIAHVHDIDFVTHPQLHPRAARLYKTARLDAMLRRPPALVACVSDHTRRELIAYHPAIAARARTLLSGVEPLATAARAPDRPPSPGHILTVGAYDARKNLGGLLDAYRQARACGLRLTWISVGPTDMAPDGLLEAMRTEPGVVVTGFVKPAQLEAYWAGARLLAIPSVVEGFSYPAVEALQRGVPVVASSGSALDETLGEHGLRVAHDDVEAWAQALLDIARDDALHARLASGGAEHVKAFAWAVRVHDFVGAYREVASRV